MLDERTTQPLMDDDQQATSAADDRETQALAELYALVVAKNESSKARLRAAGRVGFTDLDADAKRTYMRERQRERRARQRTMAESTGALPLSAGTIRDALADAVMLMLAAGDARADVVLGMASKAFELPEVAAMAIRKSARKVNPRALTAERLARNL